MRFPRNHSVCNNASGIEIGTPSAGVCVLVVIDLFQFQSLGKPHPCQHANHKPHDFDLVTVAPPSIRNLRQCGGDEREPSALRVQFTPSAVVAIVGSEEVNRTLGDGAVDLRSIDRADGMVDF
jgi:hypothetical protein